jgi:hypothetical protein
MEEYFTKIWEFIRGDLSTYEFENIIYNDSFKECCKDDIYLEIISNDYRNKDSTHKLKEKLKEYQREYRPLECLCIEQPNIAIIDMFKEWEKIFLPINQIVQRGAPYWWLYLSRCSKCYQYWLVAQEERLTSAEGEQIISKNNWPTIFDEYESLLKIGKDAGKSVRFIDPINSKSLAYTVEDLAQNKPGIKLSQLAALLNLDMNTALAISQKVIKEKGVKITLNE